MFVILRRHVAFGSLMSRKKRQGNHAERHLSRSVITIDNLLKLRSVCFSCELKPGKFQLKWQDGIVYFSTLISVGLLYHYIFHFR